MYKYVNNQTLIYIPKLKQSANYSASKIKHNYQIIFQEIRLCFYSLSNQLSNWIFVRPFWIYTTVSFYKTFSSLPLCVCVKILSILKKKKKKMDICNFVLCFGMLILCRSRTCAFVLIRISKVSLSKKKKKRFSKVRLDSFKF